MATLIVGLTITSVSTSSPSPVIYVDPPISSAAPGDPININVSVSDIVANESLCTWEFRMSFDPSILNVLEETNTTNNELVGGMVTVNLPWANFTVSPDPPYEVNQTLTFNASTSTPDGGNLTDPDSYFWDFGDESNATGMVITHNYTSTGNYTVILTVTDSEGLSDTAWKDITVYPEGGGSALSSPTGVLVGETVAGETDTANNVLVDSVLTASEGPIRDLTVTNVVYSPHRIVGGETVYINITVQNNPLGYQGESFVVIAYASSYKVGEITGSLDPGESQTYNFTWVTKTTTSPGIYMIKGTVPPLRGVEEGPFLKSAGRTRMTGIKVDNYAGTVVGSWSLFPTLVDGATGNGTLATVIFEVIAEGLSDLHFYKTTLWTYNGNWTLPIVHTTVDGIFTIAGDVDGDGDVETSDLSELSKAYGSVPSKPNWNKNCDINRDNKIDASDLFDLSKNYGKTV